MPRPGRITRTSVPPRGSLAPTPGLLRFAWLLAAPIPGLPQLGLGAPARGLGLFVLGTGAWNTALLSQTGSVPLLTPAWLQASLGAAIAVSVYGALDAALLAAGTGAKLREQAAALARGALAFRARRWADARRELERALRAHPADDRPAAWLAALERRLGRAERARELGRIAFRRARGKVARARRRRQARASRELGFGR